MVGDVIILRLEDQNSGGINCFLLTYNNTVFISFLLSQTGKAQSRTRQSWHVGLVT